MENRFYDIIKSYKITEKITFSLSNVSLNEILAIKTLKIRKLGGFLNQINYSGSYKRNFQQWLLLSLGFVKWYFTPKIVLFLCQKITLFVQYLP